jgi:hypothetical protein
LTKTVIGTFENGLEQFEKRMQVSSSKIRADIEKCWKVLELGKDESLILEASKGGKFEEMSREIKELRNSWKYTVPPLVTKNFMIGEGNCAFT